MAIGPNRMTAGSNCGKTRTGITARVSYVSGWCGQMVLHVAANALLKRRELPRIACRAQPFHRCLSKRLVLSLQRARHVDELDAAWTAGGVANRMSEIKICACASGAQVEQATD